MAEPQSIWVEINNVRMRSEVVEKEEKETIEVQAKVDNWEKPQWFVVETTQDLQKTYDRINESLGAKHLIHGELKVADDPKSLCCRALRFQRHHDRPS